MSTRAPITVVDSNAANVVFTPVGISNDWEVFANRPDGRSDLQSIIALRFREPSNQGQPTRVDVKIRILTTKVDGNGNTVKDQVNMFEGTWTLAPNSTTQTRADLLAETESMLSNAMLVDLVENLTEVYGA